MLKQLYLYLSLRPRQKKNRFLKSASAAGGGGGGDEVVFWLNQPEVEKIARDPC